jgi:hypothetical protein
MTTVEVYYYPDEDYKNTDTFAISYTPLDDNSKNTASTTLREADLYTESGIIDGKLLVTRTRYDYNNTSIYSTLTQLTISIFVSKGNLSGIVSYEDGNNNNYFFTPSYQSGFYFGKNVLIQIEDNNGIRKITLFISDK